MDCTLCRKPIKGYNPDFNHLKIDESNALEICPECMEKFIKWQQGIYAKLFPTKAAKKRLGRS